MLKSLVFAKSGLRIMLLLLLLLPMTKSVGMIETEAQHQSIFDLMHYRDVLQVTIETDIETLINDRRVEAFFPSTLTFKDQNKNKQIWKVDIGLRGNFRRMRCSGTPPLKLDFDKDDLKAQGLAKYDDLKLVTSCLDNLQESYDLLVKEYLAYQLFNELSEASYRVQMLRITFVDQKSGKKMKQWGFLIEDTAQVRARIGAEKCTDCNGFDLATFDQSHTQLTAVFQYMIGNSDWDIQNQRNVKLVQRDGKVLPIPYDFDFSGLVNAPYAVPNPDYQLTSVRDRVLIGYEMEAEGLQQAWNYFSSKREDLQKIVKSQKLLGFDSRREVIQYLEDFYEEKEEVAD